MKYKDFLEKSKNCPDCCSAESLNQRFAKYMKYETVRKQEDKPGRQEKSADSTKNF